MALFDLDYSRKLLHVTVGSVPKQLEGEEQPSIHGIIFNPRRVFSGDHVGAQHHFYEQFTAGESYRTTVLETEMGPGELAKVLSRQSGFHCGSWVGGMIASFTLQPDQVELFCQELLSNSQTYLDSEEKVVYGA